MHNAEASNRPPVINTMRKDALHIFQSGIDAADPYQAVKRCLSVDKQAIKILADVDGHGQIRTGNWTKIHLIAFGKAACAMARAAQEIIPATRQAGRGIAVTNYENIRTVNNVDVIGASHPLPDEAGLNAAHRIAERMQQAQQNELVLVLVSGGGSALIPCPVDSITLQEKIATTDMLLACGANINQVNGVRKHLSKLKGGGLARIAAPADLHALILSDVLGDDLSTIASGPTVPDNTTYADAIAVFKTKGVWDQVPAAVRGHLEQGLLGSIPETPKAGDPAFKNTSHTLIGSNTLSVGAIMKAAQDQGYESRLYSQHLCGIARDEAEKLVLHAKQLLAEGISRPLALLAGGETTVILKGNGRGGRNQEMALAFALAAEKHGLHGNWTFLSGGTDGRDGPTDAAGGMVDPESTQRMAKAGINPGEHLENNDAYVALTHSQDLLNTGATGTNVADLQILLIHP